MSAAHPLLECEQERELNYHKGFTLIELMMVVAVIGILAAIAFPSYQDSLRKGRRADAKAALLDLAQFTERSYTQNNTYSGITLPYTQTPTSGAAKYYNLALASATASTFSLTATPIAGTPQASDPCGTLSIDATGAKQVTGLSVSQCWN
jgi:type IV pilus assembly protein PilE